MDKFEGARIEVYNELSTEDDLFGPATRVELGPEVEPDGTVGVTRTIAAWGRAATGEWLTGDDALQPFDEDEHFDILVENGGGVFVSVEGWELLEAWLAEAFPGAHCVILDEDVTEDPGDGELDTTGRNPIFTVEYLWEENYRVIS